MKNVKDWFVSASVHVGGKICHTFVLLKTEQSIRSSDHLLKRINFPVGNVSHNLWISSKMRESPQRHKLHSHHDYYMKYSSRVSIIVAGAKEERKHPKLTTILWSV